MKRALLFVFLGLCALLGGSVAVLLPSMLATPVAAQGTGSAAAQDVLLLSEIFERVARQVSPAVVAVEATHAVRQESSSAKGKVIEESGSGFVVTFPGRPGQYVLTNNHVVTGAPPEQITIHLADGRLIRPQRVWADPETDVAVLGLGERFGNLPVAVLGDSDRARVGQWVLAIGSPFGLNQTVTHGILSARERGQVSLGNTIRIKDFLQTDAAINPGSSGGPLVDLRGEVIGINTAIASHSGTNSGVAFAIPINLVKRISHQLLEHGVVPRGYLGMQLARSFEPADALKLGLDRVQGAWVDRIYPGTPAAEAGLRPNDVVLKVDNVVIRNENHLINLISTLPAGQRIRLHLWRDRAPVTVEAVVGDWNKAQGRFQQP